MFAVEESAMTDPRQYIFLGIALLAFGLLKALEWAVKHFSSRYVVSDDPYPEENEAAGNVHSDAQEPIRNIPVPEPMGTVPGDPERPFTLDELLTELARIEVVHRDGHVGPLSQDKIAGLIGGRREETLAAIKQARGETEPEPVKDLRVKDASGQRMIAR
jgi:hypothetical protein